MNAKEILDELFSAQECEEILEFQVRGQYRDNVELEPTFFEFGSCKTKCSENVAQWARRRNSDKYNYNSGYAVLSKVDKTRNALKKDAEDFVQVAVPSLSGFLAVTADPDYLAERLTKSAQQLVAKYKATLAQASSAHRERQLKTVVPFDATYFVGKDGKHHVSQYVIVVTIEKWTENNKGSRTKPTLGDVDLLVRLRSTLNADCLPDKSALQTAEGFADDGFCYGAKLGHFTGMLKSEAFKAVHRQAADFLAEQNKRDSLACTSEETVANVTKPPAKHRIKGATKRKQQQQQQQASQEQQETQTDDFAQELEEGELPAKLAVKRADAHADSA